MYWMGGAIKTRASLGMVSAVWCLFRCFPFEIRLNCGRLEVGGQLVEGLGLSGIRRFWFHMDWNVIKELVWFGAGKAETSLACFCCSDMRRYLRFQMSSYPVILFTIVFLG